jgi:arsenate reductase
LLNEHGAEFRYREYTKEPLTAAEIRGVLKKLGLGARDVLRSRDAKKLGLSGSESEAELVELMAEHPTLLQRPIGVRGRRAALGRPVDNLLVLVD